MQAIVAWGHTAWYGVVLTGKKCSRISDVIKQEMRRPRVMGSQGDKTDILEQAA